MWTYWWNRTANICWTDCCCDSCTQRAYLSCRSSTAEIFKVIDGCDRVEEVRKERDELYGMDELEEEVSKLFFVDEL